MKRKRWILLLIFIGILSSAASAEDWANHAVSCPENRFGCRLLQMVMMGSFDEFQPDDALTVRLFSAVYPQLCTVTEDDFHHFLQEYGEADEAARERYYQALAHCLRASFLLQGIPRNRMPAEMRVLMLYLDPADEVNAEDQRRQISAQMTEDILNRLADAVQAPPAFVRWLLEKDDAREETSLPGHAESAAPAGS